MVVSQPPSARTSEGYIVRRASHPTVASDACLPRLLLVVQQVHYSAMKLARLNNDTPSFRSMSEFTACPEAHLPPELQTHSRPVGGSEPLTGRDLTVIRSM
jgi:hypothetical protein